MTSSPTKLITEDSLLQVEDYLDLLSEVSSKPRFQILYYLDQHGEDNASSIAESLDQDSGTCRHHLKRLVDAGLIRNWQRESRSGDGNYSYYETTSLGERFTRYVSDIIRADQQQVDGAESDSGSGEDTHDNNTNTATGTSTDTHATQNENQPPDLELLLEHSGLLPDLIANDDLTWEDVVESTDIEELRQQADTVIESSLGFDQGDLPALDQQDIRIIGCGGGGVRIVDRIHDVDLSTTQTITIDTDEESLNDGRADTRALIGKQTIGGRGTEGNLKQAQKAVQRADDALERLIGEPDLVFVLAGLGGGTGTALAPEVARKAGEAGAIVVSIATLPFSVEEFQLERARMGLSELSNMSDTLVVLNGRHLSLDEQEHVPLGKQLLHMNDSIARVVSNLTVGIGDFRMSDRNLTLPSMLKDAGNAVLLGTSLNKGESYDSLTDRLLRYSNVDITEEKVERAVLGFSVGTEISGDTIDEMISRLSQHVDEVAWTAIRDHNVPADELRVTGIMTGVGVELDDFISPNYRIEHSESNVADVEIMPSNREQSRREIVNVRGA